MSDTKKKSLTLTLKDRLVFQSILAKAGKAEDIIFQRDILDEIKITSDEAQLSCLKSTDDGRITASSVDKVKNIIIDLNERQVAYLKEQVEQADREGRYSLDNLDLCLKIKEL